ncbi:MAG: hypothetical protein QXE61_03685 [Nitrososphaerota archaeon]
MKTTKNKNTSRKKQKEKLKVTSLTQILSLPKLPNKNLKIRVRNKRCQAKLASIGEGLRSCDRCGRVDRIDQFICIYHGPHGEKLDICSKCLKEGRVNAERK